MAERNQTIASRAKSPAAWNHAYFYNYFALDFTQIQSQFLSCHSVSPFANNARCFAWFAFTLPPPHIDVAELVPS